MHELCPVLCDSHDGRGVRGRMDRCICMAVCLHCSPETITISLVNQLYPNTKLKVFKKKTALRSSMPQKPEWGEREGGEAGKERGKMGWYATDPCPVPNNMSTQCPMTIRQLALWTVMSQDSLWKAGLIGEVKRLFLLSPLSVKDLFLSALSPPYFQFGQVCNPERIISQQP